MFWVKDLLDEIVIQQTNSWMVRPWGELRPTWHTGGPFVQVAERGRFCALWLISCHQADSLAAPGDRRVLHFKEGLCELEGGNGL